MRVALDDRGQRADVGARRAPRAPGRGTRPCGREVAGDDGAAAVALHQRLGQLGADLAVGADDEDLRHRHRYPPIWIFT